MSDEKANSNDSVKSLSELAIEHPRDKMIQAGADREMHLIREAAAKGHQPAIDFLAKIERLRQLQRE